MEILANEMTVVRLRFDCFYKNPHYHVDGSGEHNVHKMKDENIEDAVFT